MNETVHLNISRYENSGAPVRALFFFVSVWLIGRIIFSNYGVNAELAKTGDAPVSGPETRSFKGVSDGGTRNPEALVSQSGNHLTSDRFTAKQQTIWTANASLLSVMNAGNAHHHSGKLPLPILQDNQKNISLKNPRLAAGPRKITRSPTLPSVTGKAPDAVPDMAKARKENPLSAYFWLFARQNDGAAISNPSAPFQIGTGTYGGSQVGAILSYRLTGNSVRNVSLFGRISAAAATNRFRTTQEEGALGVKAKPFSAIPVTIHAEQRIALKDGSSRGQAFYLAGGTGPSRIAGDIQLETYGQAGYVLNEQDTYFFDASATLQKTLIEKDRKKLTLGAGIWAGGEENVRRLDVGPRANLRLPIGEATATISLDWRQKIAGNAAPDSGLALTVATGF